MLSAGSSSDEDEEEDRAFGGGSDDVDGLGYPYAFGQEEEEEEGGGRSWEPPIEPAAIAVADSEQGAEEGVVIHIDVRAACVYGSTLFERGYTRSRSLVSIYVRSF